MDTRTVNEVLRDRRIELGMSQQTLADRLGKSHIHIWKWEKGIVNPRLDSLTAWSAELGCQVQVVTLPSVL
jgi:transcriptional regulator with XRE-family HTH domain